MDTKKILSILADYAIIVVGCILYVMAWTSFLLPRGIVSGGLTGLSAILSLATGVSVDIYYISINAVLIILGTIILGKGFGFKTIFAILVSTLLLRVLGSDSFEFLKSVSGQPLYVESKVLIPIIGGMLEAIGIAMIFQRGASTGGTDVAALIINKFWPVSPGKVYIYCDLVIIASILLIPGHSVDDMVYGYIAMITFSFGVDYVLMGRKSAVQIMVFSNRYAEIADYINNVMNRGVTALNAIGWYTHSEKKVLLVMVRKYQLREITRAIKSVDPKAFVAVSPANDVYGEGFEEIKTGIEIKKNK